MVIHTTHVRQGGLGTLTSVSVSTNPLRNILKVTKQRALLVRYSYVSSIQPICQFSPGSCSLAWGLLLFSAPACRNRYTLPKSRVALLALLAKVIRLFVCQGPANAGSYLILKIKKIKIILVGASLTPMKEPNAIIGEIISPI